MPRSRPEKKPHDPVDGRRIIRLFAPYKLRVAAVAGLIGVSALVGLAQPFLLREIIDVALPENDTQLLTYLVLGMVLAAMVGAVIDVRQSYLSNVVGQQVMHGLRAAVYDHLQKMSLAFFTKTRGGEVQSRISNDIGAMQGVVTQTVTSLVGALTTVIATLVAMLALDWRLALATLAVVPFFIWLSRTVGTLVAFTTLQTRLLMPMITLLRLGVQLQSSLALFTRVFEYLDTPVDLIEPEHPIDVDPHTLRGEVQLQDLSFEYSERSGAVLDHVDLTAAPGTTLAIVGATGSGKTTLGYLAARLYDPTGGRVLIDGYDLRELSAETRSELVGVVSQETHLLHATVAENLRFAKPGATDEELRAAARAAQIDDLLSSLPDGYDTVVGERGYRFSGGERQRLAIARIVLRDPPVLILDEATSALDTKTELAVQDALDALSAGRTTIAIAHRLSTIADADQIAVLDHGRVVELGSHDELVAAGGAYAALLAASRREAAAEAADPELAA